MGSQLKKKPKPFFGEHVSLERDNSLSSIFDMVYSNTNPECKIGQWSLVIQPSGTPASYEIHASEENCTENLTICSIFFNLGGEEERINVQKGRIFFIIWYNNFNGKFQKKKKFGGFFPLGWGTGWGCGEGAGKRHQFAIPFVYAHIYVCMRTHIICLTSSCWEI